ncbi:transmembrane protein C1orf162 homolog [Pithys albifrons albifrons]|uniref:transmembrane protein C1orf162 homolog n=1 Tax=Pithys albifrons albifrons TaxID=3385563 RepID=UPI003A5CAA3D
MGGSYSKETTVRPTSTTPTVPTTVRTTVPTTASDLQAPEVKCSIENHEILYLSLAFVSGILLTVLVFAIIYLCRKKYKKSHQNLQEEAPEEFARNTQNEITYSTLVFQRTQTPLAV